MQQDDTTRAEFERQRRRIQELEERLARLRTEIAECRTRMSECSKHLPEQNTPTTVGDPQMAHSTRATIDSIRARLERVETDWRNNVEHEREAAVQRQNLQKQS